MGIVGLPNTGKSTMFNALTKKSVPSENFPFCTIDPSVGVVSVPDERLEKLAALSASEKVVPAVIEFVDIAGLVRGAAQGEGLGNAFLSHIREVDAIAHVVRCFEDDNVIHVDGGVDPLRDIEVIETELLLADVQLVERRLVKIEKEVKRGNKDALTENEMLKRVLSELSRGRSALSLSADDTERRQLASLGLLTAKPMLYVCNIGAHYDKHTVEVVQEHAKQTESVVISVSVLTEQELSQFNDAEAAEMREEIAVDGNGIDSIIRTAYQTLGLISFFTTGEKETRAWTVPEESTAPRAARAIHTDFEKNFIRAEVIDCDTLLKSGSYADARTAGLLRLEGKEYIVQDGDVIIFRTG